MSKKIAEGIDALVLDVKVGRGAFMPTEEQAIELAKTLIAIGTSFGKKTMGFLTEMGQPLGRAVGNWLEVKECLDCMQGRETPDLMQLTLVLGGAMVMMGGKAATIGDGMDLCRRAIDSGRALSKFKKLVRHQGGDLSVLNNCETYPRSRAVVEIASPARGIIDTIDALELGLICVGIGAGRMKVDDSIDPKAGILIRKKAGDPVERGETVAEVYTDRTELLPEMQQRVQRAFKVSAKPPVIPPLIHAMIDQEGVHPWPLPDTRPDRQAP